MRGGFGGQLPLAYAPNPSPSYHKYDVTDYYQVYPLCGSLNDFRTLMEEADRKGVRCHGPCYQSFKPRISMVQGGSSNLQNKYHCIWMILQI
ncbi:alpha-amylase family glycosyl hydrolase [Paenibacillus polymyxa]|uniref:alpha-amylase family glycosyl hydrolase n=1 Tax=Paenibacillus TaxID=44249 RepID=UPI002AB418F2|nr:alpha-amylase family glycosyl hydrolase [Paenibacillus polymyxa]MDY8047470.1 alpha-amylase family glycosyl hydrolase [Paenibacillus polymyxa]